MNKIGNLFQVLGTQRGFRFEPIARYGMSIPGMHPVEVKHQDIIEIKDNVIQVVRQGCPIRD